MQRLAIVMSHASRRMNGAVRDLLFAAELRARGVDARIWRMHPGPDAEAEEQHGVPLRFCPADNPEEIAHRQVSAALRAEIAAFAPDFVLYKGLGYRVAADLRAALPEGLPYGFVVGGGVSDAILDGAALVLGEYTEQLRMHFPELSRRRRALVMPKYVDLALAGQGRPPARAEFDIVNVGTFAEARKNQAALLPFAARHRLAFVGAGTRLPEIRRGVRRSPDAERVTFFGKLDHPEVFGVLRRARIMVHTATADGLPRATVEAMACGLPVVALRSTIAGGIPPAAGILASEAALPHAVEMLLTDDGMRIQMGRAARKHVERHHGPAAIAAIAERALVLLREIAAERP